MDTPTPEQIERVLARLGKPGANRYFFERLENPAWIEPLHERGYFKRPPEVVRREDGAFSLPDWPELQYLKRMAPQAAEVVGKITVEIPETENSWVRALQLEIGVRLGAEHSRKLADRAIRWLDDMLILSHFADAFARFVVHLADLGEVKRALQLTRKLLASGEDSDRGRQLDEWHYERCLKICLPTLKAYGCCETLALLRDLLLDSTRKPHRGQAEDYSSIWRRDLTKANQSHKEVSDLLIDALRDAALELATRADVGFDLVRTTLLARPRLILKRIVLFVAARVCAPDAPFVIESLLDTRLVDRATCRVEYTQLLRAMYPRLAEPARARFLDAMTRDPLESIPAERQQEMGQERAVRYGQIALRDRLCAFGAVIPLELAALRDTLVAKFGETPEPAVPTAFWSGPVGPEKIETLRAMPAAELVTYLRTWVPPAGEFGAPSREGLARDLQQIVKDRPAEWSTEARFFVGLNPTYVRGFLTGLNDACAANVVLEWPGVIDLLQWVMDQPRELAIDRSGLEDEDPDWSWTRQVLTRLLTTALTHPEAELDWSERRRVGSLLLELLKDPDPQVNVDPAADRDPLTTSLNCVRGTAAHALFRFAWWIHNHFSGQAADTDFTFERMPEVKAGVELVLEDPTAAVRSVLGDWLRTLLYFDREWTARHLDAIFPEADALKPFWQAAWRAFTEYDHPYDPAFDLLKRKYELAVARLDGASDEARKQMGERGLGHHLASYYWRGVGGEGTRLLLLKYFDLCSPEAAAHVLWSLGQGLQGNDPIAATTLGYLSTLWSDLNARLAGWSELKRNEVCRHFGAWFMSGRFEDRWALAELRNAVQGGAGIADVEGVLTRLEALARTFPSEVAATLGPLLEDDRECWHPHLFRPQVEGVLRMLLASPNAAARSHAEAIVNQLIENGNLFARDLLSSRRGTEP